LARCVTHYNSIAAIEMFDTYEILSCIILWIIKRILPLSINMKRSKPYWPLFIPRVCSRVLARRRKQSSDAIVSHFFATLLNVLQTASTVSSRSSIRQATTDSMRIIASISMGRWSILCNKILINISQYTDQFFDLFFILLEQQWQK